MIARHFSRAHTTGDGGGGNDGDGDGNGNGDGGDDSASGGGDSATPCAPSKKCAPAVIITRQNAGRDG